METRGPTNSRRQELTALVRVHDQFLRMLAYRLLGDREQMDDALRDAYLRAYRDLPEGAGQDRAAIWLYRITYEVCVERLRARSHLSPRLGRVESMETLAGTGFGPTGTSSSGSTDAGQARLEAALAALPFERRAAVVLVDVMGYDNTTTANILGVREGTLNSRLRAARSLLHEALSDTHRPGGR